MRGDKYYSFKSPHASAEKPKENYYYYYFPKDVIYYYDNHVKL